VSSAEPTNPPGYPADWEADVVLSDGGIARLRPIRPDDAGLLVDFYGRVSEESKYFRFFAPYPQLSPRDVTRSTQVDYVDRVALILTVGGQMIAVGRYERLTDQQAEVSFLVEDAHQGRGVGQLLLEHLAEAARERGITGFVADVLPGNQRMAQTFIDAGYHVDRDYQDGVLRMEFAILPTDTSVDVMQRREHRAEGASMRRLLHPRRVLLFGDGARLQSISTALLSGGYRGEVVAVSTDGAEVAGVPCASSIATVEGRIDLAVVLISANNLGATVIEVAHKGAHAMVVLTGADIGTADSHRVVSLARAYGIRALGPDALGVINTASDISLNASPSPMPDPGNVGLFCQSAATGVAILSEAMRHRLGMSSVLSTGEYADVSGNDVMQYWDGDDDTAVCLLALDTLGNPRKFTRIIRRLARRKPVVVLSPGNIRRGSQGGYLGGLDHAGNRAVDALFRQSGVIVANRREQLVGIASLAARQPLPAGPRVRLVVNSETVAHQLGHALRAAGLVADDPAVLPAGQPAGWLTTLTRQALADETCDAVLTAVVGVYGSETQRTRRELDELAKQARKPLMATVLDFAEFEVGDDQDADGSVDHNAAVKDDAGAENNAVVNNAADENNAVVNNAADENNAAAENTGRSGDRAAAGNSRTGQAVTGQLDGEQPDESGGHLPIFDAPADAVDALAHLVGYAHWRARDPGSVPQLHDVDSDTAKQVIGQTLTATPQGRRLTPEEACELLRCYGISVVPERRADSLDEAIRAAADYGGDVVLKATAEATRGRPDLATVFRNLASADAVRRAWTDLEELVDQIGIDTQAGLGVVEPVVQPMVPAGVSLRLASREDPSFGPIIELGLAGVPTDLLGDTAYRVPPVTTEDAKAMVRDLLAAPMLFGQHGSPGVDVAAVEDLVHRVARMCDDSPALSRVLLTPCVVSRTGISVLGTRIETAPGPNQRDPLARML
jgi:acyl-CoA synthetase (NDP forming)/GNAT superfamily N-acetyltransferase